MEYAKIFKFHLEQHTSIFYREFTNSNAKYSPPSQTIFYRELLCTCRTKTNFSHAYNVRSFQHLLGYQHHGHCGQLLSPARKSS